MLGEGFQVILLLVVLIGIAVLVNVWSGRETSKDIREFLSHTSFPTEVQDQYRPEIKEAEVEKLVTQLIDQHWKNIRFESDAMKRGFNRRQLEHEAIRYAQDLLREHCSGNPYTANE